MTSTRFCTIATPVTVSPRGAARHGDRSLAAIEREECVAVNDAAIGRGLRHGRSGAGQSASDRDPLHRRDATFERLYSSSEDCLKVFDEYVDVNVHLTVPRPGRWPSRW